MTLRMQDGFDFYGSTADMALQQGSGNFVWDTATGLVLTTTTRFSTGQSIQAPVGNNTTFLAKSWGANDQTFTVCFSEIYLAALTSGDGLGWVFSDGATAQCGLWLEIDGVIRLRAGGTIAGAVLATYPAAFLANQWNQYQAKITIDNAAGAIHIRRNGNTVDDFSATGLNTQASANAYANKVTAVTGTGGSTHQTFRLDDFVLFSNDATAPNDWISDVRIVQQMSNANPASPLFLPSPATIQIGAPTPAAGTSTHGSGLIRYWRITPTRSGTLTTISVMLAVAMTGNLKCALYSDNGAGAFPVSLLSDTNQITNAGIGVSNFTLTTPQAVTAGTIYWLATWSSAAFTVQSATVSLTQLGQALAYTGSFPSTATAVGATGLNLVIFATYSPFNYSLISDPTEDGDSTFIYSSVVNDQDLYGIAPLATTPSSIVSVVAKMFCHKSDSGARSGALQVQSGATLVAGTPAVLSSTGGYLTQAFATDPNTGLPFTETGVNNLSPGPKVTA